MPLAKNSTSTLGEMETKDAIYFYGTAGEFGYMSNFYGATFTQDNIIFNCSEQYYAYRKCMLFNSENKDLVTKILTAATPAKAKYYGRQVKNFTDEAWDKARYVVMFEALLLKFSQNADIQKKLLSTGTKLLYEASPRDKTWGIGMSAAKAVKLAAAGDKSKFGQNLLGQALMDVRNWFLTSA